MKKTYAFIVAGLLFIALNAFAGQVFHASFTYPKLLKTPYGYDKDPFIQDAPGAINDFAGMYRGLAYCHPLPATLKNISLSKNIITLDLMKNSANKAYSWKPGMKAVGVDGTLSISPDDQNLHDNDPNVSLFLTSRTIAAGTTTHYNHNTFYMYDPNKEGAANQLINTQGLLQVYANNLIPSAPGSKTPIGFIVSTFDQEPLTYFANVGQATLTGRIYTQYVSPSMPTKGICYVKLFRVSNYSSDVMNNFEIR